MRDPKRDVTEHLNPPAALDPTRALTTYSRDGNAADAARRAQRAECATMPAPEPTAAQLAHKWGMPVQVAEQITKLEASVESLLDFAQRMNQTYTDQFLEIEQLKARIEALERS